VQIKGQKRENVVYLKKIFSRTTGSIALIFGMDHQWDKRFKFLQIKFLGS